MNWTTQLADVEKQFLAFWHRLADGRAMPARQDFKAEQLRPWLKHLHLLEPLEGGSDFRYLVFSHQNETTGMPEMTGHCISEWDPRRRDLAMEVYGFAAETAAPVYQATPERNDRDVFVFSRVVVPFGTDGRVRHLMALLTSQNVETFESVRPTRIDPDYVAGLSAASD